MAIDVPRPADWSVVPPEAWQAARAEEEEEEVEEEEVRQAAARRASWCRRLEQVRLDRPPYCSYRVT